MRNNKLSNTRLRFNNFLTGKGLVQLLFYAILILIVIVLLFLLGKKNLPPHPLYCSVRSFFDMSFAWGGDEGLQLEPSALTAVIGMIGAVLFGGLLISVLTNVIINGVGRIRRGEVEYKHLRNHLVVIGFDDIAPSLVVELVRNAKNSNSVIVLYSCQPIDDIRDNVCSKCNSKETRNIVFMHSTRTSFDDLKKLHTENCKEIFVVGDRRESGHDSENMRIVRMLLKIHAEHAATDVKKLNVWFENESSYTALQLNDIKQTKVYPDIPDSHILSNYFHFIPRNFYSGWAKKLLVQSYFRKGDYVLPYPELDHDGIRKDSNRHVHLIVIGMNRMGVALAKETAHLLHFPNFLNNRENRTVITFIDDHADMEMNFFKGRHPGFFEIAPTLFGEACDGKDLTISEMPDKPYSASRMNTDFLDVRFQFVKGRVETPAIRKWLVKQAEDKSQYLSIAVCLENPADSIGAALYLPEQIYFNNREAGDEINIYVRQQNSSSLVESLMLTAELGKNKKYSHVYPFGMFDNCMDISSQENIEACALNYVYDYYFSHSNTLPRLLPPVDELKGSMLKLPISLFWSNIYLADSLEFKLRSIGYDKDSGQLLTLSDEDRINMAMVEHNRWNVEKLLMGYRAPHPDEATRMSNDKDYRKSMKDCHFVHSDIRPYADLDEATRQNDLNIVDSLAMVLQYSKANS